MPLQANIRMNNIWLSLLLLLIELLVFFEVNGYQTELQNLQLPEQQFKRSSKSKTFIRKNKRLLHHTSQRVSYFIEQIESTSTLIHYEPSLSLQQQNRKNIIVDVDCSPNNGSYMDFRNKLCLKCKVKNCNTCIQKYCLRCITGFYLKNNYCLKQNCTYPCQKCSVIDNQKRCTSCIDGYYLNDMQQCLHCHWTCKSCFNGSTNCTQCLINYYPRNYISTNSSNCYRCFEDCLQCESYQICNVCQPGYQLTLNKKRCYRCNFPCAECVQPTIYQYENTKCKKCAHPFNMKPNKYEICFRCTTLNCKNCGQDHSTCVECWNQYELVDNLCINQCQKQCILCYNNKCRKCQIGYVLVHSEYQYFSEYQYNKVCKKCIDPRCQICSQRNVSKCLLCRDGGYANSEGVCIPCPLTCQQCLDNICLKTRQIPDISGTSFYHGQAVPCQNGCVSCQIIDNTTTGLQPYCFKTEDGFYAREGEILLCQNHCIQCFAIDKYICEQCVPGFVLVKQTSQCVKCIDAQCSFCNPLKPKNCYACRDKYQLKNFSCISCDIPHCKRCINGSCIICNQGYVVASDQSGHCVECLQSCLVCSSYNLSLCLSCGNGYFLENNICYPCLQGCFLCKNNYTCQRCMTGYLTTFKQICTPICKFPCYTCQEGRGNQHACTSCIAGYQLTINDKFKGECRKILKCNGTCKVCPIGYFIIGRQCIQCGAHNCAHCNVGSLDCQSCFPGYFLDVNAKQCFKCNQACQTCISEKICYRCNAGYVHKHIRNQPFYIGRAEGQCVKCTFPCKTCFTYAEKCTACVQGYKFKGWKCVQIGFIKYLIVLDAKLSDFYLNYRSFNKKIIEFAGQKFQKGGKKDSITSLQFSEGSARIIQRLSIPQNLSAEEIALTLKVNILPETKIINREILTFQILKIKDTNINEFQLSSKQLGISFLIGIPLLVGVAVLITIIILRKTKKILEDVVEVQASTERINPQEFDIQQQKRIKFDNIDQFYL